MVIDNGPGAAVRTDILTALQALITLSSGPLEPETKYAGMWWLDTSVSPNGSLKMRNLSNTAWTFPSIYGDDRVGEIAYYARPTPPPGWLKANGAVISRVDYSALFAAIGTQFGIGDGVNTFNIPDMRGQFVRGWDDGAGVDPSRAFGSLQDDELESHGHTASTTIGAGGSHDHAGWTDAQGYHAHSGGTDGQGVHRHLIGGDFRGSGTSSNGGYLVNGGTNVGTTYDGNHGHNVSVNAAGSHGHNVATDVEPAHSHTATTTVSVGGGGLETRPKNVSLLACIRYA